MGVNLQGKGPLPAPCWEGCNRCTLLGSSDLELREAPGSTNGFNYGR